MVSNFVEKNDALVQRMLEMIPGLLTWALISSPVWLGIFFPEGIIFLITFFAVYWAYLAIKSTVGIIIGYKNYKFETEVDWWKEVLKLDKSQIPEPERIPYEITELKHFVLIPIVNEGYEILKPALDSILYGALPTKNIFLIYTIEEKYAEQVKATLNRILEPVKDKFYDIQIYVHPAGIVGEAIGVGGANRTWGAKHAVEYLKEKGENLDNFIFSSLDADHVLHKQYLARLHHLFVTSDKRDNRFYTTAVHLFNNNHWRVPFMMRIEANSVTLGGLSDWAVGKRILKDTFAAYSTSLTTLVDANYWDVALGVDDSVFYWRMFFVRKGDVLGTPHYVPYSADAVEAETIGKSHISLYKQLLRWGWGVITFPLSVKFFLKDTEISLMRKLSWVIRHIERSVILINIVFIMTFGFSILTLVNPYIKQSSFAYSIPDILSIILTITLIFLIPATVIRNRFAPEMPKDWPLWRRFFALLEGPLVILNLLTFSFFPFIEAQTRMLLGKRMKDLYHTPKIR